MQPMPMHPMHMHPMHMQPMHMDPMHMQPMHMQLMRGGGAGARGADAKVRMHVRTHVHETSMHVYAMR